MRRTPAWLSTDTSSSEALGDKEADLQSRSCFSKTERKRGVTVCTSSRKEVRGIQCKRHCCRADTRAAEFVHCRLEQIHEYDREVRVGVTSKDPQMTTVDDEAAQPEKQPIVDDE